jgi:hypothetical protein
LVDEGEQGLLQADRVRAGAQGRVAVPGQDVGDIEGQTLDEPAIAVVGRRGIG